MSMLLMLFASTAVAVGGLQLLSHLGSTKYLGYFDDITEAANVVQNFRSNPELGYSERHGV